MQPLIIHTTCDNKQHAKKIAKSLLNKQYAVCIQISKIKSLYLWDNKVAKDKEWLLAIKTKKAYLKKIKKHLLANHTYETPEIITTPILDMSKSYKKWYKQALKKHKSSSLKVNNAAAQ